MEPSMRDEDPDRPSSSLQEQAFQPSLVAQKQGFSELKEARAAERAARKAAEERLEEERAAQAKVGRQAAFAKRAENRARLLGGGGHQYDATPGNGTDEPVVVPATLARDFRALREAAERRAQDLVNATTTATTTLEAEDEDRPVYATPTWEQGWDHGASVAGQAQAAEVVEDAWGKARAVPPLSEPAREWSEPVSAPVPPLAPAKPALVEPPLVEPAPVATAAENEALKAQVAQLQAEKREAENSALKEKIGRLEAENALLKQQPGPVANGTAQMQAVGNLSALVANAAAAANASAKAGQPIAFPFTVPPPLPQVPIPKMADEPKPDFSKLEAPGRVAGVDFPAPAPLAVFTQPMPMRAPRPQWLEGPQ